MLATWRSWLRSLADGFGSLTLDPAPRLRRLRLDLEREQHIRASSRRPLPPLPESAYTDHPEPLEERTWPPESEG